MDAAGNSHVVGSFGSPSITFGEMTLNNTGANDVQDGFVVKYDASGNVSWLKGIGGSGSQGLSDVVLDASGNLYIVGSFSGSTSVGMTTLSASGSQDILLVKLDANGDLVWARKFGGTQSDSANSIAVDASGNIYLAGQFQGSIMLGSATLNSAGDFDMFAAKLDANGDPVWAQRVGGTLLDSPGGIALDSSNNVILQGNYTGSINVGGTFLDSVSQTSLVVAKFDNDGTLLWGNGATASNFSFFTDVKVGVNDVLYVCGRFRSTLNVGAFALTSTSGNSEDAFVGKLDANGNWLWATQGGSAQSIDYANHLAFDPEGNLVVAGYYTAGSSSNPAIFGLTELFSYGGNDAYVAGMDKDGNWLWATRAGSAGADLANAVATDPAGNIYTTGFYSGAAEFPPHNLAFVSFRPNVFVAKLSYPQALSIVTQPQSIVSVAGLNAVLSVTVSGVEPVSYQWFKGSDLLPGETGGALSFSPLESGDSGEYRVQVSNPNTSAFFSDTVTVTVYPTSIHATILASLTFGSTAFDTASRIARDATGNLYLVGYVGAAAMIGDDAVGGAGAQDALVVKLSPTGQVLWAWSGGGTGFDTATTVTTDAVGNAYVGVSFTGSATFGGTTVNSTVGTAASLAFLKFNAAGELDWVRDVPSNGGFSVSSMQVDATGALYVLGQVGFTTGATALFGSTEITSPDGLRDAWVAKLNSDGSTFDWAVQFTSDANLSIPGAMDLRPGGGVWVGGLFQGTVDFGGLERTAVLGNDVFIAGVDASGNVMSAETWNGGNTDNLLGLVSLGNSIGVVAQFNGSITLGGTTYNNLDNNADIAIWKQSTDGMQTVEWSQRLETVGGSAFVSHVSLSPSGRILISGSFANIFAGVGGSAYTGSLTVRDGFVVSLNVDGSFAQFVQSGANQNSLFQGVVELASGDLGVFGSFSVNITVGGQSLETNGSNDFAFLTVAGTGAPEPGLMITDVVREANGTVTFKVVGPEGMDVSVEFTNAIGANFGDTVSLPNTTGTLSFEDATAAGQAMRFYRAYLTPAK